MRDAAAVLGRVLPADRIKTDLATLLVHESDGLTLFRERPLAVAYPMSTLEVAACVKALRKASIPIVPRGAGTGLAGGARPCCYGVVQSWLIFLKKEAPDPEGIPAQV